MRLVFSRIAIIANRVSPEHKPISAPLSESSTENSFPERTIARLVLILRKVCYAHCSSTALVHNCRDALPSLAITNIYNISEKRTHFMWQSQTKFLRRLKIICTAFCIHKRIEKKQRNFVLRATCFCLLLITNYPLYTILSIALGRSAAKMTTGPSQPSTLPYIS